MQVAIMVLVLGLGLWCGILLLVGLGLFGLPLTAAEELH